MKTRTTSFALIGAICLALSACTPGSGVSVQESDVIVTVFNRDVDFGALKTFQMPDTIIHLTGDPDKPDSPLLDRKYDKDILALVEKNFTDRNYARLPDGSTTDFVVTVSATALQNWYVYGGYPWWGYWGWYPGWGCCGGGYYPGYPPSWGVSYAYSTGTLIVEILDPSLSDPETMLIPVQWSGVQNGVLDDTESSKQTRVTYGINQMFIQSPYLESRVP